MAKIFGMPGKVATEQLQLLAFDDVPFVVGSQHRENDQPIFVFGRTLNLAYVMLGQSDESVHDRVWRYTQEQADLRMFARTYSVLAPQGREMYLSVRACWPCEEDLFRKAEVVGWDMRKRGAPVQELTDLIAHITERTEEQSGQ